MLREKPVNHPHIRVRLFPRAVFKAGVLGVLGRSALLPPRSDKAAGLFDGHNMVIVRMKGPDWELGRL